MGTNMNLEEYMRAMLDGTFQPYVGRVEEARFDKSTQELRKLKPKSVRKPAPLISIQTLEEEAAAQQKDVRDQKVQAALDIIAVLTCQVYGIRVTELRSEARNKHVVEARALFIKLVRAERPLISYAAIARWLGKHHSTVMHAENVTNRHPERYAVRFRRLTAMLAEYRKKHDKGQSGKGGLAGGDKENAGSERLDNTATR